MPTPRPQDNRPKLDLGFAALLALVVAVNWLVEPKVLQNDTKAFLHMFHSIYTELFLHGELQGWDPFYYMGAATDMRILTIMSCPLYFTALLGKLLHVTDAFTVLKCGLVLEQMVLTAGMYLLGLSLYRHRRAALFAGLCAALSAVWIIQAWFNFRHYAMLPLELYLIVEFFKQQRPGLLFASGVVFALSQLGSTGYFLPVQVLALVVFTGTLGAVRRARGQAVLPGLRAWLAPESLAWLAALAALGLAFVAFCTAFLRYDTMAGYAGRDPLTGKVSLHNFLTLLNDPEKALSSLWELVYAAPRDWIFTLYAGLFAVPFALYGLVLRKRQPSEAYAPTLAGLAVCLGLALGQTSFVAPLAYQVFPLMDRSRYILSHLGLVKCFFIIAAGFGVDVFLTALARNDDVHRRQVRLAAWLCAGVCAAVLAVDMVYGLAHGYPYKGQLVPYAFHFLPLGLLAAFALYLFTTDSARTGAFAWLAGLAAADLASYAFILLFAFLPDPSTGVPGRGGNPLMSEREFRQGLADMRQALAVTPYPYQPRRAVMEGLATRDPLTAERMAYYNFEYADLFNFFHIDFCNPNQRAPVGHINTGLVRFMHAKLGLDLDEPLHADSPWIMDKIMGTARYLGGEGPKAFLAADVFETASPYQAATYLAEVDDAPNRPVVLPAEPNFAPLPQGERAQRPQVRVCLQDGLCREGAPESPAYWDAAYAAYANPKRSVFYTFPRPKTVVKYRLDPANPGDAPLMPLAWTLWGSDDGLSWTLVDRRDDLPPWTATGHRDFSLPAPVTYRHFVFDVERSGTPGRFVLGKLRFLSFNDLAPAARTALPVRVDAYRANGVTMRADVPQDGPRWLIYLDNADPGWKVFVDGHPAPLFLANLAFKAVRLEPGAHTVVFDYQGKELNRRIAQGFLASGALFTAWALWLIAALAVPALPAPFRRPGPARDER